MKKLILTFALFASLFTTAFAENMFSHRFFEVKLDVPVNLSNNLIALTDIFTEKVVIDLPKIADDMGKDGASFNMDVAPSLNIGIDIPRGLIFGVGIGAEASAGIGLSKDIFEFIGKGNVGKDSVTAKMNNTFADLFAYATVNGGWNGKKLRVNANASAFWALAHVEASDTYVMVYQNEENESLGVKAQLDGKFYSTVDARNDLTNFQALFNETKANLGFDVGADVSYKLFRYLDVGGSARIPIVPSHLTKLSAVNYKYEQEINIMEMMGSKQEGEGSGSGSGEGSSEATEEEEKLEGLTDLLSEPVTLDKAYAIHRPMKLGVSANFHPFGTLLTTNGYIGLGIRHPFATDKAETDTYVEYEIGGRLSLWNILSFEASHSYYDEIFKNELKVALNIRLVEVDAGVSLQSANFAKSFQGAGVGAFVTVCIGF
ncbi:MAG: hypothetical protein J5726_03830 [Treponema sp.]|nr:hypothetical protein [Treponema sp.]